MRERKLPALFSHLKKQQKNDTTDILPQSGDMHTSCDGFQVKGVAAPRGYFYYRLMAPVGAHGTNKKGERKRNEKKTRMSRAQLQRKIGLERQRSAHAQVEQKSVRCSFKYLSA